MFPPSFRKRCFQNTYDALAKRALRNERDIINEAPAGGAVRFQECSA